MERLPRPARLAVAIGLLVLLVGLVVGAATAPLIYLAYQDRALEAADRRIAELRLRMPMREGLQSEVNLLERAADIGAALLQGATPAVAAAQLQGDLVDRAAAVGGAVDSIQVLEPEPAPPFVRISLRLDFQGDIAALRDFIHQVESSSPILFVGALAVNRPTSSTVAAEVSPPLSAVLEVYGYTAAALPAPQLEN